MEISILIIVGIICLVLGFCISKLIFNKENTEFKIKIKNMEEKVGEVDSLKNQLEDIQSKFHQNDLVHQRIATELIEREKNLTQLTKNLNEISNENKEIKNSKNSKNKIEQDFSALKATFENCKQSNLEHLEIITKQNGDKYEALLVQNDDLKKQLAIEKNILDQKSNDYLELSNKFSILKTSLDEREKNFSEQTSNFNKQKEELSIQFKALANDILDAKAISLQETSRVGISAVINPFQQSIDNFKKEVQDIHHRETV